MIRSDKRAAKLWREHMEERAQGWLDLEDKDDPPYDPSQPVSIFNHSPFTTMSTSEFRGLERSWP
jgi:hypothetical protein